MTGRRRYKNPPIEQAICEFRFAPEKPWDPTLPGRLAGLQREYDGTVQELRQVEWGVAAQPDYPSPALTVKEGPLRVRFENKAANRAVEVAPSVVSIQAARPYVGWVEDFRPRVHAAFNEFREVARPAAVVRIGIRYINRMVISGRLSDSGAYFQYLPHPPKEIPMEGMFSTTNRSQFTYADGARLNLTVAGRDLADGRADLVLDLDVSWEPQGAPMDLNDALAKADALRSREREAFEALITDSARETFDA